MRQIGSMIQARGFQPSRYHLVVVDDEKMILSVLRLALRSQGYGLSFFEKPAEALRFIEKESADLILTDYHMPEMNGLELIRESRALGWDSPALVMSGLIDTVPMDAFRALGVDQFLEKPFSKIQLDRLLQETLLQKVG